MQESGGTNFRDFQCVCIGIIDHQCFASLLDVDDEFRLEVGSNDGGNARLGVVLLLVNRHATGGDDFQRLQCVTLHDDKLGWPVGARNHQLVRKIAFFALVLGSFNRSGFQSNTNFCH